MKKGEGASSLELPSRGEELIPLDGLVLRLTHR
jgi:hypothetical protein